MAKKKTKSNGAPPPNGGAGGGTTDSYIDQLYEQERAAGRTGGSGSGAQSLDNKITGIQLDREEALADMYKDGKTPDPKKVSNLNRHTIGRITQEELDSIVGSKSFQDAYESAAKKQEGLTRADFLAQLKGQSLADIEKEVGDSSGFIKEGVSHFSTAKENIDNLFQKLKEKYQGAIDAVDSKKGLSNLSLQEKEKLTGMTEQGLKNLHDASSVKVGKLKNAFGSVVDSVKTVSSKAWHKLPFNDGESKSYSDFRLERRARLQNKAYEKNLNHIINARAESGRRFIGSAQELVDSVNSFQGGAVAQYGDKGLSEEQVKKQFRQDIATHAKNAGGGSGKFGWKGKVGAVVGLRALGGVLSNFMDGGQKSNGQLYNPNPQPQYYS